jgi:1-acyl-sn-glycerol-3-phosphate acyltransferase
MIMDPFADIRPYNDDEVRPVLDRLLQNEELLRAVTRLNTPRFARRLSPWLLPLVRFVLRRQLAGVSDVHSMQLVIKAHMDRMILGTTRGLRTSGLERLCPDRPYLFISNHRDIALDPAFVNYSLYHNGHDTVRIAIGDNLLTKDYAADLMRLNKSFIVRRSAGAPRQMLAAYRQLSAYVRQSLLEDGESVWIAQREGRAKDGFDETEPAIIKMLAMSLDKQRESFADYIRALHIVPVAISYQYDPLDETKAAELAQRATTGRYLKGDAEDVLSIARGIAGQKGAVHVAYGTPISQDCADASRVAEQIDRQIIDDYVLHSSNFFAYEQLHGVFPDLPCGSEGRPFTAGEYPREREDFERRLEGMSPELRPYVLAMYANCIVRKLERKGAPAAGLSS